MTVSSLVHTAELRRAMAGDPHRPLYHFLPPANWMNDPNGFIHWQGRYHLFYQYNPDGAYHGNIHWGHAISPDLVHWEDRPVALTPTPNGPDAGGCWSGSTVIANGVPTFFYSGVFPQTVCMATGDADLDTWVKHPTPLIAAPPPGFGGDSTDFRDPYVWRDGDTWYMVIGSRVAGGGGAVLLYRSTDLLTWDYAGPLLVGDVARREPFWTGSVWECPNFFPLDDRHVLIVSYQDHARGDLMYPGYVVGDFGGGRFTPGASRILEHGGCLYAPQVTVDERGRAVLIGWLMEGRDGAAQRAAGWSGVMSLPRVLSLGDDDTLRIRPIPELTQLRGERFHLERRVIQPGWGNVLGGVRGDCLEIEAVLNPFRATAFGLRLRCSPDGAEQTTIRCDAVAGRVTIDRRRASLDENAWRDEPPSRAAAEVAPLTTDGPVRLHVFLDRSVVEVFVNDQIVLSGRVYPTRPDSLGVELFAEGGALRVESLDVWQMRT